MGVGRGFTEFTHQNLLKTPLLLMNIYEIYTSSSQWNEITCSLPAIRCHTTLFLWLCTSSIVTVWCFTLKFPSPVCLLVLCSGQTCHTLMTSATPPYCCKVIKHTNTHIKLVSIQFAEVCRVLGPNIQQYFGTYFTFEHLNALSCGNMSRLSDQKKLYDYCIFIVLNNLGKICNCYFSEKYYDKIKHHFRPVLMVNILSITIIVYFILNTVREKFT